ncbi:hypothetical protein [Mycobacterium sherrisii]|uniref:Lipoprotein n=1 Tax=Mycobacterium sherrisii TaxID=243061 RepID=A0A1E3T2W8_9MYCO|nr:hypothetical protein [Mycobacterium sherrisii]MCV7028569.1 hypothetical protein [Mycobacterium sherrisii]ODR08183.1 hypothetical protein BHQ21_07140 [Mycobacterium sherrisii]ORW78937.1 hypothetical protein AWC25_05250 [Mycobacterium sherrisii]
MSAYGFALAGAAACVVLTSCSETASPPATTPTPSTSIAPTTSSSVPPPPPITGPLEKDWKSYAGTAYFGCPEEFHSGKSALEEIRPKIFDTRTGQYVAPALPTIPADENLTGAMCALSGTAADLKVVYVVATVKTAQPPAPEVHKTTGYAVDFKTGQPAVTKDLQPPTPELQFTDPKQWRLGATTFGAAWLNAFTDGNAGASPPRTVMLSVSDLAAAWNDPEPAQVWQDVLSFHRKTQGNSASGAELRRPSGEVIYQDNDVTGVDAELSDGPDKLVQITRRDAAGAVSTTFVDLNSKTPIKIGDSDRVSGGGLAATLSDGKLFIDGRDSADSQFGFGVWNLRTGHWDLLRDRDEAKKLPIAKMAFFDDHLYITNAGQTFSVLALPAPDPVATNWNIRPFERISGWTLVCRGETTAGGECKEIVMVQDQDGHYPGPWF